MEKIFLGTASIPTKDRNCHSLVIRTNKEALMIDCGEGVQRQMMQVPELRQQLDYILLTHDHLDHIYGLVGVLAYCLLKQTDKNIVIGGPSSVLEKARALVELLHKPLLEKVQWSSLDPHKEVTFGPFQVIPFETTHTPETLGYLVLGKDEKIIVTWDMGEAPLGSLPLAMKGADTLVMDGVHTSLAYYRDLVSYLQPKQVLISPLSFDRCKEDYQIEGTKIDFPMDLSSH